MSLLAGDLPCRELRRITAPGVRQARAIRDSLPDGAFNTVSVCPLSGRLEVEDLAYSPGSAITLPVLPSSSILGGTLPWIDSEWAGAYQASDPDGHETHRQQYSVEWGFADQPVYARLTLTLAAVVYRILEKNSSLTLHIAGHADPEEAGFGPSLGAMRAQNFASVLSGNRGLFIASCTAFSAPADLAPIGAFLEQMFGWPRILQPERNPGAAAAGFRAAYNAASSEPVFREFFPGKIPESGGAFAAADWGALFDCYMVVLAALMDGTSPAALAPFRGRLTFLDAGTMSSGYASYVRRDADLTWRSTSQRRTEVLFFPQEVLEVARLRGSAGVYDPGLCEYVQLDPNWLRPAISSTVTAPPSFELVPGGEPKTIKGVLSKRPRGYAYIQWLREHPTSWLGDDEGNQEDT